MQEEKLYEEMVNNQDAFTEQTSDTAESVKTVSFEVYENCCQQLTKAQEQLRYLQADFENFRRNAARERVMVQQATGSAILCDLLDVVDDFERAIAALTKESGEAVVHDAGIMLIYKKFVQFLERQQVTELPADEAFDPHKHEALLHVDAEGKQPGEIVAVLQKGYRYKDTVIRPAKVSVAK